MSHFTDIAYPYVRRHYAISARWSTQVTVTSHRNPHIRAGPYTMLGGTTILSHLAVPLGVTVFLVALARYLRSLDSLTKSKFPYPPGPKGLPLIGNLLDLPRDIPIWEGFSQMAGAYGTQVVLTFRRRTHDQSFTQGQVSCISTYLEETWWF